ncbi:hypothetical protein, partial [Mesorhizobium sp.]|uniref:hypothetical protein n=1 Tax=Mesorhizobium sp. TaxID=1871066 RepID=UPI0025C51953
MIIGYAPVGQNRVRSRKHVSAIVDPILLFMRKTLRDQPPGPLALIAVHDQTIPVIDFVGQSTRDKAADEKLEGLHGLAGERGSLSRPRVAAFRDSRRSVASRSSSRRQRATRADLRSPTHAFEACAAGPPAKRLAAVRR